MTSKQQAGAIKEKGDELIHKLKKTKQRRNGHGNEYQLGNTIFKVSRYFGFRVYDKAIGTNDGQAIFSMGGGRYCDFRYGVV